VGDGTEIVPARIQILGIKARANAVVAGMSATKHNLPESNGLPQVRGGDPMYADKFSVLEVAELRSELIRGGLDARDAAELMQRFLAGRGYGVSLEAARAAAFTVEGSGCSLEVMQRELNRIAMVQ